MSLCLSVVEKIGQYEGDKKCVTSGREVLQMLPGKENYCDRIAFYGWFIEWWM
jgi:hypothetical protein